MNRKNGVSERGVKSFLHRWSARKIGKADKSESDRISRGLDSVSERNGPVPLAGEALTGAERDHPAIPDLPDLRQLLDLFRRPEISILDGLNEYDRDYTDYVELNGILTQELQRKLAFSRADRNPEPGPSKAATDPDSDFSEFPESPAIPDASDDTEEA